MEEDHNWWAPAIGATILLIIFGSIALVAAGGWTWFSKFLESAAPAWVQAIGSVGAIAAAAAIFRMDKRIQAKRDADMQSASTQSQCELADLLLGNGITYVRNLKRAWEDAEPNSTWLYDTREISDLVEMLREAMPAATHPDVTRAFLRSRVQLARVAAISKSFAGKFSGNDKSVQAFFALALLELQVARGWAVKHKNVPPRREGPVALGGMPQ